MIQVPSGARIRVRGIRGAIQGRGTGARIPGPIQGHGIGAAATRDRGIRAAGTRGVDRTTARGKIKLRR